MCLGAEKGCHNLPGKLCCCCCCCCCCFFCSSLRIKRFKKYPQTGLVSNVLPVSSINNKLRVADLDRTKSLIHSEDYRDLKFLQRISAAGLFGTLMSSSGLAYALVLTWPVEHCLMFAFQMVGVPLALHAYLRTCLGLGQVKRPTLSIVEFSTMWHMTD